MNLLRTPDKRFENLPDYPFEPNYIQVDKIRIHYVDEGPKDAPIILLLHGEPSWSFLYRHMIPILKNAGFRVLAPDLVGFGKSDKPTEQSDHTYRKHVEWMRKWLLILDLNDITLFCQDWGSLIGLRLAIENQDRFSRIVLSNGGLPTGKERLPKRLMEWVQLSKNMTKLYIGRIIQGATITKLSRDVLKGYEAPFPDETYKAGARILPSLIPISKKDPEHKANKNALDSYFKWKKPFLTAFSDGDPLTRGGERLWKDFVPGAKEQKHVIVRGAGHFIQEEKGPELAKIIIEFIKDN